MTGGSCSYGGFRELYHVSLPSGKSLNDTSIWSKRVIFSGQPSTNIDLHDAPSAAATKGKSPAKGGSGDNPNGDPTPTNADPASPWKRTPTPVAQENEDDAGDEIHHVPYDGGCTCSHFHSRILPCIQKRLELCRADHLPCPEDWLLLCGHHPPDGDGPNPKAFVRASSDGRPNPPDLRRYHSVP
jgi:hypothetical protein